MMRPSHGDELGFSLLKICFPQEGIAVDDAPLSGGLTTAEIEMQMRPAAAAAFFAEDADGVAHFQTLAELDIGGDRFQVAIAIEPAAIIEEIDDVGARGDWSAVVTGQSF